MNSQETIATVILLIIFIPAVVFWIYLALFRKPHPDGKIMKPLRPVMEWLISALLFASSVFVVIDRMNGSSSRTWTIFIVIFLALMLWQFRRKR